MHIYHANIAPIAAALGSVVGIIEPITNGRVASSRTVSFDLPMGKYFLDDEAHTPIDRVKLTANDDGTIDIRAMQTTRAHGIVLASDERHTIQAVAPDQVGQALFAAINH